MIEGVHVHSYCYDSTHPAVQLLFEYAQVPGMQGIVQSMTIDSNLCDVAFDRCDICLDANSRGRGILRND